jgi:hypothetical protein
MSHAVNLQSIIEQLFLLEHIAYGSQKFCESYGISSFDEAGYQKPLSAWSLTKTLVCERIIDIAIKGRILLDHVEVVDTKAPKRLEEQAVTGLRITHNVKGQRTLSVRESFNKIIHATQVSVSLSANDTGSGDTHYWDGQIRLEGTRDKKPWVHQLVVADWAKAVRRIVIALEQDERLEMLGWDGGF